MSKYTREQLRSMARATLKARDTNDPRYVNIIMSLCIARHMGAKQVEHKIEELAK